MKLSMIATVGFSLVSFPALADESAFLKSIAGKWSGQGTVITKIGSPPLNVTCTFGSRARGQSLTMAGQCRGLVVVRRSVSADIRVNGTRYSGTYVGPSGRPARLSGARNGNAINFSVRWSRDVNGDRMAQMSIQRIGNTVLQLQTVDKDLTTGRNVVTSDIRLNR